MMKIDATKIIGLLLAAMIAMAGWYLQALASEVRELRGDVFEVRMQNYRLAVAMEIGAGGDPSTVEVPGQGGD